MSEAVSEVTGVVLCAAEAHSCRCREPVGHESESPHLCPCGGAWRGEYETASFEVVSLLPLIPQPDLPFDGVW
jgi:hypothetical protein